ncbi:hypothetical protein AWU65_07015 [Paenibacillus glucanolyticus]|uniref:Uncharacterized protein n=1 Tax=Paenibacillus glucanolyticus TaxID=59843 RepID=A0A163HV26_9BACL|nr:hypothetical protein [Paenibacillus glucanolyticus]KZS45678.1 hypothetical protein AWU65_07015 [Paenibacillus glucanolyticus]
MGVGLKPDESKLVKDYILLPLLLDVLEKDRGILSAAALKMPVITNTIIERLQKAVLADLSQVRRDMRQRGLKVYEERKTRLGVEVEFLCRGYHHKLSMLWGLVESEIEQRSYTYLALDIVDKGREF